PVTITLAWSLTPEPGRRAADIKQDLFLLWPGEITEATAPGQADPTLVPYVEQRGFTVISSGRLLLRSRDRLQLGTTLPGEPIALAASVVPYVRRGPVQARPGTFINGPWTLTHLWPLPVRCVTISL